MHTLNRVKSSPNIWATSAIFKKYPKQTTYHPLGENSPNLVTLSLIDGTETIELTFRLSPPKSNLVVRRRHGRVTRLGEVLPAGRLLTLLTVC
jgi:hypothetical protein